MIQNKGFRADINGLRAIAVIAVVLFHFGIAGFGGGFIGVDVFFVISGFLMTGIIVKGLDNPTGTKPFGFFNFYMARARRIIPALFFLSLVLIVVGWSFLSPDDYHRTSREIDQALLFVSNNHFYKHSGYFDSDAHERLLLHTWSLSVEWQFYIIYPIIILMLMKLSRRLLPWSLLALLLISFAISVYKSHVDANYAFYLIPSRAWEMLLGGMVLFIKPLATQIYNKALHFLGILLIAMATYFYSPAIYWPGFAALLPTFGAALVIYSATSSVITDNGLFQKLGEWSYSIYLWHWPFVVALLYLGLSDSAVAVIVALGLSVIFSLISFYGVEDPLRKLFTKQKNSITAVIIFLAVAILLSYCEYLRKNDGFPNRISGEAKAILAEEHNRYAEMDKCHDNRQEGQECIYGQGDIGAIVMGDSHAMSIMKAVVDVASAQHKSTLDLSGPGCPPIRNLYATDSELSACVGAVEKHMQILARFKGVPIFITSRYAAILHGRNEANASTVPNLYIRKRHTAFSVDYVTEVSEAYFDTFCALAKNNPVVVFRPTPELKQSVPKRMGRSLMYQNKLERVSIPRGEYESRNKVANGMIDKLQRECGIYVVDTVDKFCDEHFCYGDIDGMPVYFDDDHLSLKGAALFNADIEAIFNRLSH